jgi:hypothetical protein
MMPPTVSELARARERAAGHLEAAIIFLGIAYASYQRTTNELSGRAGSDLTRRLEVPLVLHLVRAGLSEFLDRKLTGAPASLRMLVEEQHRMIETVT